MSRRPNSSTACCDERARRRPRSRRCRRWRPPCRRRPTISSTTWRAGVASVPSPAVAVPRSFTTTRAPSAASRRACARPIPRPAPVTTATLPSSIPMRPSRGRSREFGRMLAPGSIRGSVTTSPGKMRLGSPDRKCGAVRRDHALPVRDDRGVVGMRVAAARVHFGSCDPPQVVARSHDVRCDPARRGHGGERAVRMGRGRVLGRAPDAGRGALGAEARTTGASSSRRRIAGGVTEPAGRSRLARRDAESAAAPRTPRSARATRRADQRGLQDPGARAAAPSAAMRAARRVPTAARARRGTRAS